VNFKENESDTKLRGGYYTSSPIAAFLVKWVLNKKPRSVLEPSCGDGAFVRAFRNQHRYSIAFTGVELLLEEATKARESAHLNKKLVAEIINCDFLGWALEQLRTEKTYNAVVGNPPYIRYQYLEANEQELSERIFTRYQLAFTKHTNAWVPFVIASIGLLAPGGRLAMVIPSELLHVLHAGSLRKFLLSECHRILMIDPNELLFEEALQGTVLLMVEKKVEREQASHGVAIVSAPNNDFLYTDPEVIFTQATYVSGDVLNGKWMKVLLEEHELEVFERVRQLPEIKLFSEIATVDVGIVTGANKFFLVDDATVEKYGLQKLAQPMFGKSAHCPGIVYSKKVHKRNAVHGLPTNFVQIGKVPFEALSSGVQSYIRSGEEQKLQTRYKCRIRTPWYSVPSVYATNLGMLKRSYNYPRLILNLAGAYTTDTAYRITTSVKPSNLVYGFINSLTALSAELEGRHYGGGVLELVPSEIEKLLIPYVKLKKVDILRLDAEISAAHDADKLLAKQDDIVLKAAGLTKEECMVIHKAWLRVRSRRQRLCGKATERDGD
jgi:adenine-specific DNA-methyltransferase